MARQAIIPSHIGPLYINETLSAQTILPNVFLNQTSAIPPTARGRFGLRGSVAAGAVVSSGVVGRFGLRSSLGAIITVPGFALSRFGLRATSAPQPQPFLADITGRFGFRASVLGSTVIPNARASQVVFSALSNQVLYARASQVTLETLAVQPDSGRASQVVLEVLVINTPGCGPIPVFPAVPVGFPVKWRPTLKTTVNAASSGREVRWPNQKFGLHEFELTFEVLRDKTQNQVPYSPLANFQDYMLLCQFWLMMYGRFGLFYFDAPWDDSRLDQNIGTGDGHTLEFLAYRTFGTAAAFLNEPVGAINQITNVKFNGVVQSPSSYSISGNIIAFNVAPPAGVNITATFSFFYLCKFQEDRQDFEEFFKNIWRVPSLRFRSVYWPLL